MTGASSITGTGLSAETAEAARCIERWLLQSGVQIEEGPQRGAVAGWLDREGNPEFVYLEITGYYLNAMAWLASGAASSPDRAADAHEHGRQALDWITRTLSEQGVPPTRLYLSAGRSDWRNSGVFTFDLAMAARGVACFGDVARHGAWQKPAAGLCAIIESMCSGASVLRSHDAVAGAPLPDRWSTQPGPHHLKAAAALLRMPDGVLRTPLRRVCHRTCDHGEAMLQEAWPCRELHPLLYGIEGLLIGALHTEGEALEVVERLYARLMALQAADGTLAETVGGGIVRSDVLAQALRIGLLLRGLGYLQGDHWAGRLEELTRALLGFVRPDGGVLFSGDQDIANVWCAMFAHQALVLRSRSDDQVPLTAVVWELLV
ncbi:hypothetical protein J7E96_14125 [Streptomyces sp. ISL-96]|uniref:hypothetical protein n=1 Tax=Streptomyces sp. ISL-96 TaxID=2819191 RepID=UPI001BEC2903|nr:hypothetical protein [Streptomyces sp. ISL-96]MBT2489635.1 hypothetical protein [Streptomyces sp. ISL-96]